VLLRAGRQPLSLHNDKDAFLVLRCDIPNTRDDTAALDQM